MEAKPEHIQINKQWVCDGFRFFSWEKRAGVLKVNFRCYESNSVK